MAATRRLTPAEIAQRASALGLDPNAVLSVGSTEGLSGGIGDGGHAFGPWQLNDAGGVITGKFPGWTQQQKQEWAWSPQGVDYALGGINKAAHGLHGADAVRAIVNKFERPADPQGEIARALGSSVAGSSNVRTPSFPPGLGGGGANPQPAHSPIAQALSLLGFNAPGVGRAPAPMPRAPAPAPVAPAAPASSGGLAELIHEGVGGPTHSTGEHIHAASRSPEVMLAIIAEAQRRGLAARENPYVDAVDPVHAKNSFHNQTFPGTYNGRPLGQAVDVSGAGMSEFEKWLKARYA